MLTDHATMTNSDPPSMPQTGYALMVVATMMVLALAHFLVLFGSSVLFTITKAKYANKNK